MDVVIGMDSAHPILVVFVVHVICIEIEMLREDKTDGVKKVQSSMFILKTKEKWLARTLEWEYITLTKIPVSRETISSYAFSTSTAAYSFLILVELRWFTIHLGCSVLQHQNQYQLKETTVCKKEISKRGETVSLIASYNMLLELAHNGNTLKLTWQRKQMILTLRILSLIVVINGKLYEKRCVKVSKCSNRVHLTWIDATDNQKNYAKHLYFYIKKFSSKFVFHHIIFF